MFKEVSLESEVSISNEPLKRLEEMFKTLNSDNLPIALGRLSVSPRPLTFSSTTRSFSIFIPLQVVTFSVRFQGFDQFLPFVD